MVYIKLSTIASTDQWNEDRSYFMKDWELQRGGKRIKWINEAHAPCGE